MRLTQVNGETYINADDIADWIVLHNEDLATLEEPWPSIAIVLEDLAKNLRDWGRDHEGCDVWVTAAIGKAIEDKGL